MKIAHILLTYTDPLQTERMVSRLQHEDSDFFVQLDRKIPLSSHQNLRNYRNVYFIQERVDVKWGGYSMLQSIFNALQEVLLSGVRYDFINLLSGQDYPLKSASYIQEFLSRHGNRNFLSMRHFDTEWRDARLRIDRYHMTDYGFRGRYLVERTINLLLPKRKCPLKLDYFGGSMFWTISPEAAAYVLGFVDRNPAFRRFLRFTWSPSEFVFQTVLMNSDFRTTIERDDLMESYYPQGSARPKFYTSEDLEELKSSSKLFARKFNIAVDPHVLDKIDAWTSNGNMQTA